jgi:hypothetical protein
LGDVSPVWGWASLRYGQKEPALSLRINDQGRLPLSLTSEWQFPQPGFSN